MDLPTIDETGYPVPDGKHDYYLAYSGEHTYRVSTNIIRMQMLLQGRFGPDAAFSRIVPHKGRLHTYLAAYPADVVMADVRTMLDQVRDGGWMDEGDQCDYLKEHVDPTWFTLPLSLRVDLVIEESLPAALALAASCPGTLHRRVQAIAEDQERQDNLPAP